MNTLRGNDRFENSLIQMTIKIGEKEFNYQLSGLKEDDLFIMEDILSS